MKNVIYYLITIGFIFALGSCSIGSDESTQRELDALTEISAQETKESNDSLTMAESVDATLVPFVINPDMGFTRDTLIVSLSQWDKDTLGQYLVSNPKGSYEIDPAKSFKAKRGDVLHFDKDGDSVYEQSDTINHPWFTAKVTFHEQYDVMDSVAYARVDVFTYLTNLIGTFESHTPWGDYYLIRNGVRYNIAHFAIAAAWCNGEKGENPFTKIYVKHGDVLGLDYNRDGIPEYEYTVKDPRKSDTVTDNSVVRT